MQRLDAQTVKLLASGVVVRSVSSAVKELLENAMDAGVRIGLASRRPLA